MPKLLRRTLILAGSGALAAALTASGLFWASRQVPDFYEQQLAAAPPEHAAENFEQQALALHNQLQHAGRWETRFTEEQINAWLATELPEKFPAILPAAISDPRIALSENLVRLAARYQRGNVETVISLAGDVYLTDQPNEVAIRIQQARAGYLPLPLGQFLDEIRERAARADVSLRWTEIGGAPVALVRVPSERGNEECEGCERERLLLEEVALQAGQIVVAGRIESDEVPGAAPPAPIAEAQADESATRQR